MTNRDSLLTALLGDPDLADEWPAADEDVDGGRAIVEQAFPQLTELEGLAASVLLNQIAADDPPETGQTAARLLDEHGLERRDVMEQLVAALLPQLLDVLAGGPQARFDDQQLADRLAQMPLPRWETIASWVMRLTEGSSALTIDDVVREVLDGLGVDPERMDDLDDPVVERVALTIDELTADDGPLALLVDDRVLNVAAAAAGVVATHVLSAEEIATDRLRLDVDLVMYSRIPEPATNTADLHRLHHPLTAVAWEGPPGWLDDHVEGDCIAVRADADGRVTIEVLPQVPDPAAELIEAVRHVYDAEVVETGLPARADDLVFGLLGSADRDLLTSPQAPFSVVCTAAGLDQRGDEFATDRVQWRRQHQLRARRTLHDMAGDDEPLLDDCVRAIDLANEVSDAEVADPQAVIELVGLLSDEDVLELAVDAISSPDQSPSDDDGLAARLLPACETSRARAAVRHLAALSAERAGDVLAAEQHLHLAHEAHPRLHAVVEHLAWYASDRGDLPLAVRLLRRVDDRHGHTAHQLAVLDEVKAAATQMSDKGLSRNAPCWCGSGRKFKRCHLGQAAEVPLEERVGWLDLKARNHLRRAGGAPTATLMLLAMELVGEDPSRLPHAMADPLIVDLTLHEGGGFADFLAHRAALLPDDEALLAASWQTVDRSVHEVISVEPGVGLELRDLRSGQTVEVRERTFSHDARAGELLCARVVPDGRTSQLVGAVLTVPPGREAQWLDVLAGGDPAAILHVVIASSRPPSPTA